MNASRSGERDGVAMRPPFPMEIVDEPWVVAFNRIADVLGDRIALDDGRVRLSYRELAARANQVAHAVIAANGGEGPVALLGRQSTTSAISVLAGLHAGRFGVPLDAAEPPARLRLLLELSTADVVLTARAHAGVAEAIAGGRPIVVVEDTGALPRDPILPADDAPVEGYLVFTSGSTGTPKGVVIGHEHLVRDAVAMVDVDTFPLDARLPLITSFGLASAIGRLLSPLVLGATVCPLDLPSGGARELADWVNANEITSLQVVPSVLRSLAALDPPVSMPSVHTIQCSGEQSYADDVHAARRILAPDVVFTNGFGSTESYTTFRHVIPADVDPGSGPLPAGEPVPGVEVRLVDVATGEPVAGGEAGQLVTITNLMSVRYWNDPELTSAHYFRTPDGRTGFRTNDLFRRRDDGLYEHLGRLDARAKVRGAMVATAEVERALQARDDIVEAAAVTRPTRDGGTRLEAFVVAAGSPPTASQLRRDLAEHLPSAMLPSRFTVLDELPRMARGKVDRIALANRPEEPGVPFREPTGAQRDLAIVFAEVLGVERVGADDDFFELGGDSLAAVELVAAITERFGVDVPTTIVLDAPTVALLSPRLHHRRSRRAGTLVPLGADDATEATTLVCATGAGAPALSLRALAGALPDRRCFGIQPRGLEERAWPDRSVEAAAARAGRELRTARPTGPVAVAGYSFGALVAFELACRLEEDGHDAGVLIVLDGVSPVAPDHRRRLSVRAHARRALLMTSGVLPHPGLEQYDRFLELNAMMARRYVPTRRYGGRVLLIRTRHPELERARGRIARDDFGWARVCAGPVRVVDVPGEHLAMLRSPVVQQVAAEIDAELRAFEAGTAGSAVL